MDVAEEADGSELCEAEIDFAALRTSRLISESIGDTAEELAGEWGVVVVAC